MADLADWFGIEAANDAYVDEARSLPTVVATVAGEIVGVCLVKRHFPEAAEVELIAVRKSMHRRGVGRQILDRVEMDLLDDGVRVLQVKTLGPSVHYEPYEQTRRFYRAQGYLPLEEHAHLWPSDACLVMVKYLG